MKDDWEYTIYAVADRVHMPVYRMKAEMPMKEFIGWIQYMQGPKEKPIDLNNVTNDELAKLFGDD